MEEQGVQFEKVVDVRYQDKLERITVKIWHALDPTSHNRPLLHLQLTNEADGFFLFHFEMNEETFQHVKAENNLLVDFNQFPHRFIEKLENCIMCSGHEHPKFQAHLEIGGETRFRIVETEKMAYLTHISVAIRAGNDAAIKKYLADKVTHLKESNAGLQRKLLLERTSMEQQRADAIARLSEAERAKQAAVSDLHEGSVSHAQEQANLREAWMREKEQLQLDSARMKEQMEGRHSDTAAHLNQRISTLDEELRCVTETKARLEGDHRELQMRCTHAEADLSNLRSECDRLRGENKALDALKHENEKRLNQNEVRLSTLTQQVVDKEVLIANLNARVDAAVAEKGTIEESVAILKHSNRTLEEKVTASINEIVKGNQIIERLSSDVRSAKSKLKSKSEASHSMQKELQEKQLSADRQQHEIANLNRLVQEKASDVQRLEAKLQESDNRLDECQKALESNKQMIQWLNKELTEAQVSPSRTIMSSASTHSSPFSFVPHATTLQQLQAKASPPPQGSPIVPSSISTFPSSTYRPPGSFTAALGAESQRMYQGIMYPKGAGGSHRVPAGAAGIGFDSYAGGIYSPSPSSDAASKKADSFLSASDRRETNRFSRGGPGDGASLLSTLSRQTPPPATTGSFAHTPQQSTLASGK